MKFIINTALARPRLPTTPGRITRRPTTTREQKQTQTTVTLSTTVTTKPTVPTRFGLMSSRTTAPRLTYSWVTLRGTWMLPRVTNTGSTNTTGSTVRQTVAGQPTVQQGTSTARQANTSNLFRGRRFDAQPLVMAKEIPIGE